MAGTGSRLAHVARAVQAEIAGRAQVRIARIGAGEASCLDWLAQAQTVRR